MSAMPGLPNLDPLSLIRSFLVPGAARGRGCGRHLALAFLHYAPCLGYQSSIFNLVFATNVASIRLWDKLGFERVGTVKGAGRLKGHTELVDAYIYGYQFPDPSAIPDGLGVEKSRDALG